MIDPRAFQDCVSKLFCNDLDTMASNSWTCAEAEWIAGIYRHLDRPDMAAAFLSAHAHTDEDPEYDIHVGMSDDYDELWRLERDYAFARGNLGLAEQHRLLDCLTEQRAKVSNHPSKR